MPPSSRKARTVPSSRAIPAAILETRDEDYVPSDEEDDDEDALEFSEFMLKGKKYLKLENGACWVRNADGSRGKWAGLYNATKDKLDTAAPEPKLEEN